MLLLLIWIAFVPDTLPGIIVNPRHSLSAMRLLVSAFLCVLAIVPLVVVLFGGSPAQRVVSALALIFPALVFLWIIMGGLR